MANQLLLLYFLLYIALAFVVRSLLVWRQTGINPFVLGTSDSTHDFIGKLFRLVVIASALIVFTNAVMPQWMIPLTSIAWLDHSWVKGIGWLLLIASLLWIAIAQAQMGASWRIGIDRQHKTELVHVGLFTRSRNPIFLGMRFNLLGLFLTVPNAATLLIWVLGDTLMQIQVRLEEEHLSALHGESYVQYRREVRRWL